MPIPEHVRDYKKAYSELMESGLPISEFCQRYNVSATSFHRWGSQIVIYDLEQKSKTSFVEVGFVEESATPKGDELAKMTVSIGDSIKIEFNDNFNTSAFEKAVTILSRLSC